jgi:hypothetical protein
MIASEAESSGMIASEAESSRHSWGFSFTVGSGETDLEGHKLERWRRSVRRITKLSIPHRK